ncbi:MULTISPECIES: hypothetical protein [unclassified Sphingomonas]|jgi:hypothetical protein|uniref:hypothetical protein n=1 Tax=unclassified Sphingomonas TaxID=196159 RepID=UPI0008353785|nr:MULTISPECIES: hypothetical protein [unclassified Sphingomonas]
MAYPNSGADTLARRRAAGAPSLSAKPFGAVSGSDVSNAQRTKNREKIMEAHVEARGLGLGLLLDGQYEIGGGPLDLRGAGTMIYCGSNARIRQFSNDVQIVQFGGDLSSITGTLNLWHDQVQGNTGASIVRDGTGGAIAFELWDAVRCTIDQIRTFRSAYGVCIADANADGTANQMFDTTFGSIDVNYATYRGVDLRSRGGGSTASFIGALKVRGQGLGQRTDMNVPIVLGQMRLSVGCLNVEHMRYGAVVSADGLSRDGAIYLSDGQLTVDQLHFEGIEFVGNNRSLMLANTRSVIKARTTDVHDIFLTTANGVTNAYLASLFGTGASVDLGMLELRTASGAPNTGVIDAGVTLGLARSSAAVTRGEFRLGRVISSTGLSYISAVTTNDQRVTKEIDGVERRKAFRVGQMITGDNEANGTLLMLANTMYAHRVEIHEPVTFDQFVMRVTGAGGTGAEITAALYHHTGNPIQPGALVAAATGTKMAAAATGERTMTGAGVIMPGVYWFASQAFSPGVYPTVTAIAGSAANTSNTFVGTTTTDALNASGSAVTGVTVANNVADQAAWNAFAFPATFPAGAAPQVGATPRVALRASVVVGV